MSAILVPYPLHRRHAFVLRHAAIMASLSPAAAERHLDRQLRIQASTLLRRGIDAGLVDQERQRLAIAIRHEVLRILPSRGSVA
jgi:hypothetical protein